MTPEQRYEDRRERLVEAAYTLFALEGFGSTTIERLCATARISTRAFYEHFDTREDLMETVYRRCVQASLTVVGTAVRQAEPTLESRIENGLTRYFAWVTEDIRRARILHLEVNRAGDALQAVRRLMLVDFTAFVEEAVEGLHGMSREDLRLLAVGLIGSMHELSLAWTLADDPPPVDRLAATAIHIFRRAFGA
ncbi:TetR/AcrR family transcriptional regulator [Rhizohabitans arisaemae]|uniref:TetR/AcrR family transcriptional regulator n=1 Tax=Rhizohabitans arisaemae TaxID=2720610 RepID=UPI0024B1C1D1|nr:TetR/AcrR family transcriptional regulator [Rhizohabitans arisaemae]